MNEIIEAVKTYVGTPEGKDWFFTTMTDVQKHHEQTRRDAINEKFRKAGFLSSKERNAEMEREIEYA